MKVFISQPMHGRPEDDVLQERWDIFQDFVREHPDAEIIDNWNKDNIPENAGRVWYLGNSISLMDKADVVIFAPGWSQAKGCKIEHEVARLYEIECMYYVPAKFVDEKEVEGRSYYGYTGRRERRGTEQDKGPVYRKYQ